VSVRVLTAVEVEAAAGGGAREVRVPPGTIVTPLARDRAAALGVVLVDGTGPGPSTPPPAPPPAPEGRRRGRGGVDVERLALESRVRILARRALLRRGQGLAQLEELVAAVMRRLSPEGGACPCGEGRR
jgi:hypothetical protein